MTITHTIRCDQCGREERWPGRAMRSMRLKDDDGWRSVFVEPDGPTHHCCSNACLLDYPTTRRP